MKKVRQLKALLRSASRHYKAILKYFLLFVALTVLFTVTDMRRLQYYGTKDVLREFHVDNCRHGDFIKVFLKKK